MNAREYQNQAMRTNDGKCTDRLEEWKKNETPAEYCGDFIVSEEIDAGGLLNACLGLSGEVGELNDAIKKWIFHKKQTDKVDLMREVGDICWYLALFCESMNFNLEEIMEMNIEKLKARYPEGFDTERANNRAESDT